MGLGINLRIGIGFIQVGGKDEVRDVEGGGIGVMGWMGVYLFINQSIYQSM